MTAEVAVMNREAVAIAADSAVTITTASGRRKIFPSANKIFALSRSHPVCLMVYDNAYFMQIPWESIVEFYRRSLRYKRFDSLEEYAADFIKFVENEKTLVPINYRLEFTRALSRRGWAILRDHFRRVVDEALKGSYPEGLTQQEIVGIFKTEIERVHQWVNSDEFKVMTDLQVPLVEDDAWRESAFQSVEQIFERLPIDDTDRARLVEIVDTTLRSFPEWIPHGYTTGVVFAGFGDKDVFPKLRSYVFQYLVRDTLKHRFLEDKSASISAIVGASITPFAQDQEVFAFMNGVQKSFLNNSFAELRNLLGTFGIEINGNELHESRVGQYNERLREFARREFIDPVIEIVQFLPKDELATMAEALVNITSFRLRVSTNEETVGGPVDVAVVSKKDGLIWMKRKHYFKPDLNAHFFAKLMGESINED